MLFQIFKFISVTFIYLCGYFLTTVGRNKEERILKHGDGFTAISSIWDPSTLKLDKF